MNTMTVPNIVTNFTAEETRQLQGEARRRGAPKSRFYHPYEGSGRTLADNDTLQLAGAEALSRYLTIERDKSVNVGGGPGYDMVYRAHKVRVRAVWSLNNRLLVLSDDPLIADIYVRAVWAGDPLSVALCGWCMRKDITDRGIKSLDLLPSRLPCIYLPNDRLRPISGLFDL